MTDAVKGRTRRHLQARAARMDWWLETVRQLDPGSTNEIGAIAGEYSDSPRFAEEKLTAQCSAGYVARYGVHTVSHL